MKILVSGASGFTGRHLCAMARDRGYEVRPLRANLLDKQALQAEVESVAPAAVVHLAAISFVGHADPLAFYEVNVLGTMNLLDALARLPKRPAKVLLSSSANVYGNCEQSPIAESQTPAPVNHYAASKLTMEFLSRTRQDQLNLFWTRPFNYTGVGQSGDFLIPKLVRHHVERKPVVELGNLDVEREFNDVRFVCASYLELLERAETGQTYNICSGRTYSLRQVLDLLKGLSGHDIEVRTRPDLVRPDEIARLCGEPAKLNRCTGELPTIALPETLRWMLAAQQQA